MRSACEMGAAAGKRVVQHVSDTLCLGFQFDCGITCMKEPALDQQAAF
jgi:hypothetical protein